MQRFLAIYLSTPESVAWTAWRDYDEATRKAKEAVGLEAWHAWFDKHAANVVDPGTPIGKTKRVDASGVADARNALTGYCIVQAESLEQAAAMFVDHPHFTLFPGDSVEVMPCLEIPPRRS